MKSIGEFKASAGRIISAMRKFFVSELCMACETLLAALFFLLKQEVLGVVVFVYIISLKLMVSDDSLSPFLPFLLIGLMVLRLYDSFDRFMAWKVLMGIPAVISVLFHFVFYRKVPRKGSLTKGYVAISFALALGGLFSLPAAHYFSGTSLYYTYGLGFGMLLLYALLLHGVNPHEEYDIREYIAQTAFYCGLFTLFMIAVQYLENLAMISDGWRFSVNKLSAMSNNLSTTVLLTMPFLFYLSRKGGLRGTASFVVGVLEGFAAVLSLSRGGIIFASAMCAFLVLFTLVQDKAGRKRNLIALAGVFVAAGAVYLIFRKELGDLFLQGIVASDLKLKLIYLGGAIGSALLTAYAYYLFKLEDHKKRQAHLWILGSLAVLFVALFIVFFDKLKDILVSADYYRGNMLIIAAKNFKKYPFFGTGMGYRGLRVVYANKSGMFGCYHCLPVQIVGSMGLFGVVAYLYMFRERLRTLKRSHDPVFAATVLFSYLGILLMSLVNPGIFCPVVYMLQLNLYFIAAERVPDKAKNPEK